LREREAGEDPHLIPSTVPDKRWWWENRCGQRSCGCPLPGSVPGQVRQDFEQPGLVEGLPAHGRGAGTRSSIRSLPTQTSL